jgi:tetraacyldisaccharide 4'-kinase
MWLDESEESHWRTAARASLAPAGWLFGAVSLARRAAYARGVLRAKPLPMRVVVVGNLMRGSEVDPLVAAWIANALHRRGYRVALADRGVGRRRIGRDAVHVVSDGRYVKSRVETVGASAMILAAHCPGIPVLAGRDRFQVGIRAASAFGTEVLIANDGFQCHALARELSVVAIDGQSGFGDRWLWPSGSLREPVRALRGAGCVGVVDGPLQGKDGADVERFGSEAFRFSAQRRPLGVRALRGGAGEAPGVLDGAAVGLISDLARPTSLRSIVEQLGAMVVTERNFRDHHRYGPRDVRYLYRNAPLWITTEKDAIRINPDWIGRADVRVLSIKMEVAQGELLLDRIGEALDAHPVAIPGGATASEKRATGGDGS